MAKAKGNKEPDKITVVAELEVSSAEGVEIVRSFEKGWTRMREIGEHTTPVKCVLLGFVRKTDEEIKKDKL